MQKNKFILLVLILPCLAQAITKEEFLALSEDNKWEFFCQHNASYQRKFQVKDTAIAEHEEWASWWKGTALAAGCLAAGSLLVTASIIGRKVFRE
jgi:hypothetical protein